MLNLQPYKLWVDCEHKTIKPDSSTLFVHHSCKLDPEDKLDGDCEECPYGKNPKAYTLPHTEYVREDYRIEFCDKDEQAFWKCPNCEKNYVYKRMKKEQWAVFTCPHCGTSYIDWCRALLKPKKVPVNKDTEDNKSKKHSKKKKKKKKK
jgi:predicted RNA-binding Zn-ribbon protein involved in translation (DUF1610 family)